MNKKIFIFLFTSFIILCQKTTSAQVEKKRFRLPKSESEIVVINELCSKIDLLIDWIPFDSTKGGSIDLDNISMKAYLDKKRYEMFNMPPNVGVSKAYISLERKNKILFKIALEPNLSVKSLKPNVGDTYIIEVEEIFAYNKLGEMLIIKNKHTFKIPLH